MDSYCQLTDCINLHSIIEYAYTSILDMGDCNESNREVEFILTELARSVLQRALEVICLQKRHSFLKK
ncbi:hypothetical protein Y032_0533g3050 [Ancylostoma ceylanicum]|uniref:Uncharacterized protein n=1 Tax=Ancylostoma ceylanicum TaxID=53326 RepID=A0A016WSY9_9BILA|nr:hypothetical protein Y032_0533g3050 [Ancylostoma ceylanicum]